MGIFYRSKCLDYTVYGKSEQETSVASKNLFDKNAIVENYELNSHDGSISKQDGWYVSDYIPVEENQSYTLSGKSSGINNVFYDKDKIYISFVTQTSGTITVPSNARYMRFNGLMTQLNTTQFEKGSQATAYEPFTPNSPSPDYPSEIKCVDGVRNLYYAEESYTFTPNESTWYFVNGIKGAYGSDIGNRTQLKAKIEEGKTYSVKIGNITGVSVAGFVYDDETSVGAGMLADILKGSTFVAKKSGNIILRLSCTANQQVSISEIQVEESPTVHKYVPYGTWLRVDGVGKNLLNLTNKPISYSGISSYNFENNKFTVTSTVGNSYKYVLFSIGTVSEYNGKTLTISMNNMSETQANYSNIMLCRYQSSNPTGGTKNNVFISNSSKSASLLINSSENPNYDMVGVLIYANAQRGAEINTVAINELQVEQNSEVTKYEPYIEPKTYFLPLDKKNLFDSKEFADLNSDYYNFSNNSLTIQQNDTRIWANVGSKIKIKSNESYTMSIEKTPLLTRIEIQQYDSSDNALDIIREYNNFKSFTFTTSSETNYIKLKFLSSSSPADIGKVSLYEGTSPEDHYELCSTKDLSVRDKYTVENGYANIDKKMAKITFNGSENWALNSSASASNFYEFQLDINKPLKQIEVLCNSFKEGNSYSDSEEQIRTRADNKIYININGNRLDTKNVAGFKQWLSQNNVVICYELAEPYTADLGQVDFPLIDGEITGIAYGGKMIYDTNKGKEL